MNKKQLVLDIAGVVLSNFSADLWGELADLSGMSVEELQRFFRSEIRVPLWTGSMSEPQFWQRLSPQIDIKRARELMLGCMKPLPAFALIPAWSREADIHLLSNHRSEWVETHIMPIRPYLGSATISSSVGCCKPDLRIYHLVRASLAPGQPVLYVDDQEKNLQPASELGWNVLQADKEGDWIEAAEAWMRGGAAGEVG